MHQLSEGSASLAATTFFRTAKNGGVGGIDGVTARSCRYGGINV
jgi:hypothetical protein